jgi:hypothetical protein
MSTFRDSFANLSQWSAILGTPQVAGGALRLPIGAEGAWVASRQAFSLLGSSLTCRLVPPDDENPSHIYLKLQSEPGLPYVIPAAQLSYANQSPAAGGPWTNSWAAIGSGGVAPPKLTSFAPDRGVWFKISEADGLATIAWSVDGSAWTTWVSKDWTQDASVTLSSLYIHLSVDSTSWPGLVPYAVVSNINA